MTINQAIKKAFLNPRKLFIVDGLGALLSAFLMGVVLVKLEHIFGIPRTALYFLALLPCLFAVYDFYAYQNKNVAAFLKGIAFINIAYCFLSLGLAIYHYQELTYFGWTYIVLEIIIVITLAIIELRTATNLDNKK